MNFIVYNYQFMTNSKREWKFTSTIRIVRKSDVDEIRYLFYMKLKVFVKRNRH